MASETRRKLPRFAPYIAWMLVGITVFVGIPETARWINGGAFAQSAPPSLPTVNGNCNFPGGTNNGLVNCSGAFSKPQPAPAPASPYLGQTPPGVYVGPNAGRVIFNGGHIEGGMDFEGKEATVNGAHILAPGTPIPKFLDIRGEFSKVKNNYLIDSAIVIAGDLRKFAVDFMNRDSELPNNYSNDPILQRKYDQEWSIAVNKINEEKEREFANKFRGVVLALLEEILYREHKEMPPSNDETVRALTSESGATVPQSIKALADFLEQSARTLPK